MHTSRPSCILWRCQVDRRFINIRGTSGSQLLRCLGNSLRRPIRLHWCWRRL